MLPWDKRRTSSVLISAQTINIPPRHPSVKPHQRRPQKPDLSARTLCEPCEKRPRGLPPGWMQRRYFSHTPENAHGDRQQPACQQIALIRGGSWSRFPSHSVVPSFGNATPLTEDSISPGPPHHHPTATRSGATARPATRSAPTTTSHSQPRVVGTTVPVARRRRVLCSASSFCCCLRKAVAGWTPGP